MQKITKKCVLLHAKGIHHVVHKYLYSRDAMLRSIKKQHSESGKVKFPYKQKKYFVTGWDYQSLKVDYEKNLIYLSKPIINIDNKINKQKPIKCKCKIRLPSNIVEVETIWKDKLLLAIKYIEQSEYIQIQSNNCAAIDLGEIHSITSIDNNGNAIIITGRKLREIKQLRNKNQAKIYEKLGKCIKGSNEYWEYKKTLNKLCTGTENKVNDTVHKITKHYLNYCIMNNISVVYYGDLDSCTRSTKENHKGNNTTRQKLSQWNYGEVVNQLENKLSRYGIKMIKVKEYYTSSTCPNCGCRHKPKNREWLCPECGYKQHRDIVGAINILNFNNTYGYKITRYNNLKYLQIT